MITNDTYREIIDILRNDAGIDGVAQRIGQLGWLFFLRIFDSKEEDWELEEDNYIPLIPIKYQWRNWAEDDEGITGDELLVFIDELIKYISSITIDENTDKRVILLKKVFEATTNYMKSGILLRQLINKINEIDFSNYKELKSFYQVFETMLFDFHSSGNAGEFYTPRSVIDFITNRVNPKIGEKVADFACGTGGFLISSLDNMVRSKGGSLTIAEDEVIKTSLYGAEKTPMIYQLCITNMMLHDVDVPSIIHGNALATNIRDYDESDKFDVILMNPPFGGTVEEDIVEYYPPELRSSESLDLFIVLSMYRVKKGGRVALVLPDSFLFKSDKVNLEIKKKLLDEYNLHTIVRLPNGVFAPYTNINTNILFFNNEEVGTKEVWFYELQLPDGLEKYSKSKPITSDDFLPLLDWWSNRTENNNAYKVSIDEIIGNNYDLNFKFYRGFVTEAFSDFGKSESMSFYATKYNADLNKKDIDVPKNFIEILSRNVMFEITHKVERGSSSSAKIKYRDCIYLLTVTKEVLNNGEEDNWFYSVIVKFPYAENPGGSFSNFGDFYELKIGIKDTCKLYFKNIFLLEDSESEKVSTELYSDIRRIENKFRYLITVFMVKRYGFLLANKQNLKQAKEYSSWYNSNYYDYRNIQSFMQNLDMRKLPEILEIRIDALSYEDIELIKEQINNLYELTEGLLSKVHYDKQLDNCMTQITKIHSKIEQKESIREKMFGGVVNNDFIELWNKFSNMRNVIAHNKPICKTLYLDTIDCAKAIDNKLDAFKIEIERLNSKEIS